jgi:hypothetical protein
MKLVFLSTLLTLSDAWISSSIGTHKASHKQTSLVINIPTSYGDIRPNILSHKVHKYTITRLYNGIEEGGMDIDMVRKYITTHSNKNKLYHHHRAEPRGEVHV